MARLYGNLLKQAGQRYYYALDSVPGIVTPGVATLTLFGRSLAISDQSVVFRTPATATLTLSGLALSSPSLLSPATAALALAGRQASLVTSITIQVPAPSPIEAAEQTYEPTLITIMTVLPGKATLTMNALELNVSQGGNIGFVSPDRATLTLSQFAPNIAIQPDAGGLSVIGYAPTLTLNTLTVLTPDPAALAMVGADPDISIPFIWVDDSPSPPMTWIDDPRS
jgi:hypothetical protein